MRFQIYQDLIHLPAPTYVNACPYIFRQNIKTYVSVLRNMAALYGVLSVALDYASYVFVLETLRYATWIICMSMHNLKSLVAIDSVL